MKFLCDDCGIDTLPNPDSINEYSVYDDVWMKATGCIFPAGWLGTLCLRCLKTRLGRNLQLSDFILDREVNEHITLQLLESING